jgi:hypothetical protein
MIIIELFFFATGSPIPTGGMECGNTLAFPKLIFWPDAAGSDGLMDLGSVGIDERSFWNLAMGRDAGR